MWISEASSLAGGCLVEDHASSSGSIEWAYRSERPGALADVQARDKGGDAVVPGHGAVGDVQMLDHTIELLAG